MTKQSKVAAPADQSPPLQSRAVVAFTGLSYLFTGIGFSFLDRRFDSFGLESFLWLVWALLGFGAGAVHIGGAANAGKTQWVVLGLIGGLLALFPGFAIYNLARWTALTLMIVVGARAAVLKTRRDFYLTLTVIFVVSFLAATHANANWTLWFYLGPAWVFGALALAWDHAGDAAVSRWIKAWMTLGFVTASFLLAVTLFFFAPRPPTLGFGFLPPGTDTPGVFPQPSPQPNGSGDQSGQGAGNDSAGDGDGSGQGSAPATQADATGQQWEAMFKDMRQAASDEAIPQWQRSIMNLMLDAAQTLHGVLSGQAASTGDQTGQMGASSEPQRQDQRLSFKVDWFVVLALLLIGYLLWRRRYRIGLQMALDAAWLLEDRYPAQSMRLSARAMGWCLRVQGHQRQAGQSVREHWLGATRVTPQAKRWLADALESYCAMRFGDVIATSQQAIDMRQAVTGAWEIMRRVAPKLAP